MKVVYYVIIIIIVALFVNVLLHNNVKEKALGIKLSYYTLQGEKITKIINEDDINSIKLVKCPYDFSLCYRVNVDDKWHLFVDGDTITIKQLFVS